MHKLRNAKRWRSRSIRRLARRKTELLREDISTESQSADLLEGRAMLLRHYHIRTPDLATFVYVVMVTDTRGDVIPFHAFQ
jgi:hypothetical protein